MDPREDMPHIEAEVSFVIYYRNGSVTERSGGHVRKKPTYTKEEVDIQRAVMNRIGVALVENERGS